MFSDGPSCQFKKKHIAHFLHTLSKIASIQWNYFATSHGKGVFDGIGGTVKRLVCNAVMTEKSPFFCHFFCDVVYYNYGGSSTEQKTFLGSPSY